MSQGLQCCVGGGLIISLMCFFVIWASMYVGNKR